MRQALTASLLPCLVLAAAALAVACADDDVQPPAPTPTCAGYEITTGTKPGATTDIVVVTATGTHCGGKALEVVIIREPPAGETIGQQFRSNRFVVVATVDQESFDVSVPIGPVLRLLDGSELRPAQDKFEVGFR